MEAQGYTIEENILHQEWEEERREAVVSSECEIFFPHGSSREREPKDNPLSH